MTIIDSTHDIGSYTRDILMETYTDYGIQLINILGVKYGFDVSEAIKEVGITSTEKREKKRENENETTPPTPIPFIGEIDPTLCLGISENNLLHTQCINLPSKWGEYCVGCLEQATRNETGEPDMGNILDRIQYDLMDFIDPKGRKTEKYIKVVERLKLDINVCIDNALKLGVVIPSYHLVE